MVQEKRWRLRSQNHAVCRRLAGELGISPIVAHLLSHRGYTDPAAAFQFLHPRIEDLHDPYLMTGMRQAVDRIMRAIAHREKILIYGDYDVDGTTSIIILKKTLEMLGADVAYHLPERLVDGYGMKEEAIHQAHAAGAKLIISADCGIRAHEVVAAAHHLGLDIIITDHHLPEEQLPPALAVLNPKRSDCAYPEKSLAGVGVAFKLVQALLKETGRERALHSFLKVTAIGTIADLVPLVGENRIIAKFGLEGLRQPKNEGLRALLDVAGIRLDSPIRCDDIAFRVGPRLNAMGRMGRAHPVIELFWAETAEHAQRLAQTLNQQNAARQQAQQRVLEEAHRFLEQHPDLAAGPVIVLAGRQWHRGVIGLAASKIVDRFYRPTIVVSVQDGLGHGSGRSIPAFHLLDGLDHCADLLERYGGHAHAAGLTIREERIPALAARLNQYAHTVLSADDLIPELEIEHRLSLSDIDFELWAALSQLEPFGVGNPKPVFAIRQGRIVGQPRRLKEQHWMFRVEQQGRRADLIWWNGVERAPDLAAGEMVSVALTVDAHHYQGTVGLRLTVRDMKREAPS